MHRKVLTQYFNRIDKVGEQLHLRKKSIILSKFIISKQYERNQLLIGCPMRHIGAALYISSILSDIRATQMQVAVASGLCEQTIRTGSCIIRRDEKFVDEIIAENESLD